MKFFFFLAALGLPHCMPALSSCGEQGPLSRCGVQVSHEVASLVAEHRL